MRFFKISAFWRAVLVMVAAYLVLNFAFPPVMPRALMIQYMIIVLIGVLLYSSFDEARWTEFKAPILAVLRENRLTAVRWGFLLAIPGIVGYTAYGLVKPSVEAPVELRQVHPAPPSSINVFDKSYDLATLENPKRAEVLKLRKTDPAAAKKSFDEIVDAGRKVYYQNCFYCHGDLQNGDGPFAHGFNPLPANFQDVGTIAQLQESFLFWRITTGGPGLPKEGTPWNSAMPVWHEMLDEDQVWNVITFLYDTVGQVPRMWDQGMSKAVTDMKNERLAARAKLSGKALYAYRCAACHGEEGAGDGPGADFLYPRPRDFTLGLFKYKTSPPETLPRDEDLFNTIKNGLTGTGMPGWASLMSDEQIKSLIPVIKGFDTSVSWAPEGAADSDFDDKGRYTKTNFRVNTQVEPAENQVAYSPESVAKGQKVFQKTCKECHGPAGRGNITSGKKLVDDWGARIWPRNLTKPWTWRVTNVTKDGEVSQEETIQAIYRRLSIGIPGTPMPSHRAVGEGNKDPIGPEDRWHVANYVYSLRDTSTPPSESGVIQAQAAEGKLPASVDDPSWDKVAATTLSLVPNIIKDDRLFTPLNDAVTVRAVYDDKEIVFLLEVADRTDSRPGEPVSTGLQDESLQMSPDAVAIQFPKADAFATAPVVEKPLFRHGDGTRKTTIWYWNAGSVEPAAAQRTMVLEGSGPDKKLTPRDGDTSVTATGTWKDGRWRVLMKRARDGSKTGDVSFEKGQFIPVSFADWDGSNGEVGSRHTLSTWYWLVLPPEVDLVKTYGLPAGIALLILMAGLLLVRSQRRGR